MLPIYQAQSFVRILKGGSTKPWAVIVKDGKKLIPYAVKLYKTKDIEKSFSVAKDVYCSVLAQEFDLDTPAPALIEFSDDFIDSLSQAQKNELGKADNRIKFGCKLIDGAFQYSETLHRNSLEKYQIEAIYAFDNLIKNGDRRRDGKPNILMKGIKAYLIDHELTLEGLEQAIKDFSDSQWGYWKERHIFYPYLYSSNKSKKIAYFENFKDSLMEIDFNILDSYYYQLIDYKHYTEYDFVILKEYLCLIQKNPDKFVNLLRTQFQ